MVRLPHIDSVIVTFVYLWENPIPHHSGLSHGWPRHHLQPGGIPSESILKIPTGSEERGVLGVGILTVVILPYCQYIENIALKLHKHEHACMGIKTKKHLTGSTQIYGPW